MDFRELIPEGFEWFIAGGYAAVPALAEDIDVWIRAKSEIEARVIKEIVRKRLISRGLDWVREDSEERRTYHDLPIVTMKIGKVFLEGMVQPVQFIVTTATVGEVLENFDVSAHQVAILSNGKVVKGPHWTPPFEPPYALRQNEKTAERLERITKRYTARPGIDVTEIPF